MGGGKIKKQFYGNNARVVGLHQMNQSWQSRGLIGTSLKTLGMNAAWSLHETPALQPRWERNCKE